jgi:hypothetical protein
VKVDGRAVVTRRLGLGEFELRALVSADKSRRVDLILFPKQVLANGAERAVRRRQSQVGFEPGAWQ